MGPEPLRVCWVIKGLGPGGAERLLVEAARCHDPSRVSIHVIYLLRQKSHLAEELRRIGCTVELLDVKDGRDLRWLPRLISSVRDRRPDIVHLHSPLVASPLRALAHARVFGRRRPGLVTTEHNAWTTYHRLTRSLNALTVRLDDATLAVSEEVLSSMTPAARSRAQLLRHGIDVQAVRRLLTGRARMREALGLADHHVVIGTIANYRRQKNYPMLLRAARRVIDADANVRFVCVGQGPLAAEIEDLHARLGLGDRVRLLGYRPDATAVLAAADVFTLSSLYEGLPVALMEALAIGLPVVATRVGGVAETVTADVGILTAPEDEDAYVEALLRVGGDNALRGGLAEGARRAGAVFDASRSVRWLEAIYASVAGIPPFTDAPT